MRLQHRRVAVAVVILSCVAAAHAEIKIERYDRQVGHRWRSRIENFSWPSQHAHQLLF